MSLRSFAVIVQLTMSVMLNAQSRFSIETEQNKAFNESCLVGTFDVTNGNIAECLEHCLENCLCESFQVCQNTKCQLCSRNKEDDISLLHEKEGCIYAVHKMQYAAGSSQGQCDGSCFKWLNCCEQPGLCLNNGTCRPSFSTDFKNRFTCECPDGYQGDRCEQPIKSCQAYSEGSRLPGLYKVLDSDLKLYGVFCDFEDSKTWTLVQSYSLENSSSLPHNYWSRISRALFNDFPIKQRINKATISWFGYRLEKKRMLSIEDDSTLLRFTCDYEKHRSASDFVQLRIKDNSVDVIELNGRHWVTIEESQIGNMWLSMLKGCLVWLSQQDMELLHTEFYVGDNVQNTCNFEDLLKLDGLDGTCMFVNYFGKYRSGCTDPKHHCLLSAESTTQIWFGN